MWMIKKFQLKNKGCSICKCFQMFLFFQLCVDQFESFEVGVKLINIIIFCSNAKRSCVWCFIFK